MSEYFVCNKFIIIYNIYIIYNNIDIFNKSCRFKDLSPNKTDFWFTDLAAQKTVICDLWH